jgi:hypothetical protein
MPLIKGKGFDADVVANYRPISNLHTIPKTIKRLLLSRAIGHVEPAPCFNRFHSAYRRGQLTATSLPSTLTDVYGAANTKPRTMIN